MAISVLEFTPASGATASLALTAKTCAAGSTIVVFAVNVTPIYALTCADNVNGSYGASIQSPHMSPGGSELFCWVKENISGGSTTITVSEASSNNTGMMVFAYEITGVPTSSVVGASDSISETNGTTAYAAGASGITIESGSETLAFHGIDRDPGSITMSGWTPKTSPTPGPVYAYVHHKNSASGGSGERGTATVGASWSGGILVAIKSAAVPKDLAGAAAATSTATGPLSHGVPLAGTATGAAAASAALPAVLTSSPLKNNTGTLLTAAGCESFVHDPSTGALVVKKTGLTTHATTAVVSFGDSALASATTYRVIWRMTSGGAEGMETLTAT